MFTGGNAPQCDLMAGLTAEILAQNGYVTVTMLENALKWNLSLRFRIIVR
jgi:hypothetical protein